MTTERAACGLASKGVERGIFDEFRFIRLPSSIYGQKIFSPLMASTSTTVEEMDDDV